MNNFIIGSGYAPSERYDYRDFAKLWFRQIRKLYPSVPLYVMEHGEPLPTNVRLEPNVNVIPCANLGHVHALIHDARLGRPTHQLCGWSASILALAMIAYNAKADFVFIEQDCLIFGDVIGQAYRDLGNGRMVFGSCKIMGVAQSLFLVKHDFIPAFVSFYLSLWADTDPKRRPEDKFAEMENEYGTTAIKRLSFGFDRDAIDWRNLPAQWYAQQLSESALNEMRARGLIC